MPPQAPCSHGSLLEAHQLCRYYRRGPHQVRAVDRVDLSVHAGEYLAVVGASGSGKSTLLNLLAGLDTPTSGRVEIAGEALGSLSRRARAAYRARRVGMIFQSFNLIAHYSALRNVELALYFDPGPRTERRPRARAILDRLGLSDRLEHRPADLSGGEQQRVAIARALVKQPEILLADEPTGNLDQENTDEIADLIHELNTGGLTVLLVTHDRDLAGRHATRRVHMHYGRLVDAPAGEPRT